MKLDQIALVIAVLYAVCWFGFAITGLLIAVPYGAIGLIPLAVIAGLLISVIVQRLNNKEDDYYDKNVDQ